MNLNNIDPEDIQDVLVKIERSFGFRFAENELAHVSTFGELCTVIENKMTGAPGHNCTTQQAFYRLRRGITAVTAIQRQHIFPDTDLRTVFPAGQRKRLVRRLNRQMGINTGLLHTPLWITCVILTTLLLSLPLFLVSWWLTVAGIILAVVFSFTANLFAVPSLQPQTAGKLAEKIARENYVKIRGPLPANKAEITPLIKEFFREELGLDDAALTPAATFN